MLRALLVGFLALAMIPMVGCTDGGKSKGDGGKGGPIAQDGTKDKNDKQADKNVKDSKEPPAPAKADVVVTAEAIAKEFLTDKQAAEAKYAGKSVEVAGEVKDITGRNNFTFKGVKKDDKDFLGMWVGCYVVPADAAKSAQLSAGQKVKVVGEFKELIGSTITLSDCKLTEQEPSKVLALKADELAKEFETDAKAASEKYQGQVAAVSGIVEEVRQKVRRVVLLQGAGKTRIAVELHQEEFGALNKRQNATLRATFEGMPFMDNEARMHSGIIVQTK